MGLVGSGTLLLTRSLGSPTSEIERESPIAVADDADAYLGLIEDGDGIVTAGQLFETDRARPAPATFAVANQLSTAVTVTLDSASHRLGFRRAAPEGCLCESTRSLELTAIEPGTAHTVAVSPGDDETTVTDAIRIRARTVTGTTTAEARRSITVDAAPFARVTDRAYLLSLYRCDRSDTVSLVVSDRTRGVRRDCTAFPSRRPGRLVLVVEPTPSIARPTVSVAGPSDDGVDESLSWAVDEPLSALADRPPASLSVETTPDVTAVTRTLEDGPSTGSSAHSSYAIALGEEDIADTVSVVTVSLPSRDS